MKPISKEEEEHYFLPEEKDREILLKIHEVEELPNLTEGEKFLVALIRTQLEKSWRDYLLDVLNEILKYKDSPERWDKILELSKKFWKPEV